MMFHVERGDGVGLGKVLLGGAFGFECINCTPGGDQWSDP